MRRHRSGGHRGQALVELAMILPLLLLIVLATLEFGIAFDHNLSLEYASREGARTGSALANGGGPLGCGSGQSPNAATVDKQIVAAVERVLISAGSPIKLANVSQIRIYRVDTANTSGDEVGTFVNRWIYAAGQGPVVDGRTLDFKPDPMKQGWAVCSRTNAINADSIGVSLSYRYDLQTALGALLSVVKIDMHDRTIMQLNPTGK